MEDKTPCFRELYHLLRDYEGYSLYNEVLDPWLPKAEKALSEVQHFRKRNSSVNPYSAHEDLWYALNRVNDFLLLSFQTDDMFSRPRQRFPGKGRSWMSGVGYDHRVHWQGCVAQPYEYAEFFSSLGFALFDARPFHPFYYEIVEVVEEPEMELEEVWVDHVFWPGLMFGNMLFSRAGVSVWGHPDTINKQIAENSILYFTFWRRFRKTDDLSHGWGHNSQWRTCFRRDYEEEGTFYLNVDGKYFLGEGYENANLADWPNYPLDDLALEERIELLTHRCFVTCSKEDNDRFPYRDTYSVSIPQTEGSTET